MAPETFLHLLFVPINNLLRPTDAEEDDCELDREGHLCDGCKPVQDQLSDSTTEASLVIFVSKEYEADRHVTCKYFEQVIFYDKFSRDREAPVKVKQNSPQGIPRRRQTNLLRISASDISTRKTE